MSDLVLIPLPGVGTLELTRLQYEAALRPLSAVGPRKQADDPTQALVDAKTVARTLSLPVSSIYEHAKSKRIPSVRAGRHVRFDVAQVIAALRATGDVTVGRA